jgi:hypothetical protein
VCVDDTFRQGWNERERTASCSGAIALEQNSVPPSCGNLFIDDTSWQDGDVALSTVIPPTSNGSTITLQQNSMPISGGNLCVDDTTRQCRDVALSIIIPATRHGGAITRQQNSMVRSGVYVGVSHTFYQVWNVALSQTIIPTSHGDTIAPQQHRVTGLSLQTTRPHVYASTTDRKEIRTLLLSSSKSRRKVEYMTTHRKTDSKYKHVNPIQVRR